MNFEEADKDPNMDKPDVSLNLDYLPRMPMDKSRGIGCIGAGFIMANCHLVAYPNAGFNPVAIASLHPTCAREVAARHGIPKVYDDYRKLLEDPEVEVVDIAVPPDQQPTNAAITGWSSLFETSEALWNEVLDTNLKGTFFCSLEAARLMRDHGGGSIINISTNCAALGVKNLSVYAASKGGIHALTKQLAVELAPYKIRVNTFAPGPTQVERNLKDDPACDRNWGAVVPLHRTARPEEMVGAALFLASDDSSYMTGQIFYVDGGWSAAGRIPEANLDRSLRKHAPAMRRKR